MSLLFNMLFNSVGIVLLRDRDSVLGTLIVMETWDRCLLSAVFNDCWAMTRSFGTAKRPVYQLTCFVSPVATLICSAQSPPKLSGQSLRTFWDSVVTLSSCSDAGNEGAKDPL